MLGVWTEGRTGGVVRPGLVAGKSSEILRKFARSRIEKITVEVLCLVKGLGCHS
jgi:hypothetical protein